jgi:predicted ribonuclease YlaK
VAGLRPTELARLSKSGDVHKSHAPSDVAFSIALTSLVLEELDRHKSEHRQSPRRDKADRLIRQIAEYRARGRLVDGICLAGSNCIFAAVTAAVNPREIFDWLTCRTLMTTSRVGV